MTGNTLKIARALVASAMTLTGTVVVIGTDAAVARASTSPISANQLTGSGSNFSSGTGGWTATNATLSHGGAADGEPGSLDALTTSAKTATLVSGMVPATSGLVYGETIAIHSPSSTAAQIQLVVNFYTSAGGLIGSAASATSSAPSSGWANATGVIGIAPADTGEANIEVQILNDKSLFGADFTDASITYSAQQAPTVDGPLTVSGNQVLDANGNPVTMKAVDLYGLESISTPFQSAFVQSARQWGVNAVRLSLGEQFWDSASCNYVPNYEGTVESTVSQLTAQGVYVILDLHFTNAEDFNGTVPCPAGEGQDMADTGSVTFWQQVATIYANNPLIGFDLYNEPHSITDAQWLNGGSVEQSSTDTFTAVGMQQLYNTIRATGANNLIFIEGNGYGINPPATLVTGTNIVLAPHYYTCTTASCENTASTDPSQGPNQWATQSKSYPMFDGEFGWESPYNGIFIGNTIQYIEQHNWMGYSAFDYTPQGWVTYALVGSPASDYATFEPSPAGQPVIADTAGYPVSFTTGGVYPADVKSSNSGSGSGKGLGGLL